MHQCIKFILFWNDTAHVSDDLSVHHQEFDCTYSNRHLSNRYCCLLASKQIAVSSICLLLYVQSWTPDDGRKDRPKHVECHSKIKQIWYIGASGWFYYRNDITMHGPVSVKFWNIAGLMGHYATRGIRGRWTEQRLAQKCATLALNVMANKVSGRHVYSQCLYFKANKFPFKCSALFCHYNSSSESDHIICLMATITPLAILQI